MTNAIETGASATPSDAKDAPVERRRLATHRPAPHGMQGFDTAYSDIIDYVLGSDRRIRDERDIGLIYTHYIHNIVTYTTLGTLYDRETYIRDVMQRLAECPGQRTVAQQVLWRGNDADGFYASHIREEAGRHSEYGPLGAPTGRSFSTRTAVDSMILENKVYKQWIVRDTLTQLVQLGIDPQDFAEAIARKLLDNGDGPFELSENRRMLGQYPPESEADVSIAHDEGEAELLRALHAIYNQRMFGNIRSLYAEDCQWHGPLMRELTGPGAVQQQTLKLVAMMPDCAFSPQHICANEGPDGGTYYALRWTLDGHHLGYGSLGAPTGHHLFLTGISHFHIVDGKIVDEWVVYDELSLLVQIKRAELVAAANRPAFPVGE